MGFEWNRRLTNPPHWGIHTLQLADNLHFGCNSRDIDFWDEDDTHWPLHPPFPYQQDPANNSRCHSRIQMQWKKHPNQPTSAQCAKDIAKQIQTLVTRQFGTSSSIGQKTHFGLDQISLIVLTGTCQIDRQKYNFEAFCICIPFSFSKRWVTIHRKANTLSMERFSALKRNELWYHKETHRD